MNALETLQRQYKIKKILNQSILLIFATIGVTFLFLKITDSIVFIMQNWSHFVVPIFVLIGVFGIYILANIKPILTFILKGKDRKKYLKSKNFYTVNRFKN